MDEENRKSNTRYFCGKRFYRNGQGEWVSCSVDKSHYKGRYGCKTVTMRIPEILVPCVKYLLSRLENLETVIRNVEANPYNTSPDCLLRENLFKLVLESHFEDSEKE